MQRHHLTPDSTLYIYYFEGRIAKDEEINDKNYLGTWEEENFTFVFFLTPAPQKVEDLLQKYQSLTLLDSYEMTYEQWQGGKLEPRQIGSFLIVPPWFTVPPEEPSSVISLDPGVVFGNGLHPTTQDCIQAIEIATAGQKVGTMIDLGCGTGILSIAGAMRGSKKTVAVDYNFLACQTTRNNVALNNLDHNIVAVCGKAEQFTSFPSDLLVANIHYDVMKNIITTTGFLSQKWFILSGLLTSEAAKIKEKLADMPVIILNTWNNDKTWHTILGITSP